MNMYIIWLIVAASLIACELLTGTFYLLVIACACLMSSLSAYLGASLSAQLLIASIIGVLGIVIINRWRKNSKRVENQTPFSLDKGQRIQIHEWQPTGLARVHYRGTMWDARLLHPVTDLAHHQTGLYEIVQIENNILLVIPAKPQ